MSRPEHAAGQPPSAWNVANALTVTRILLVPVFGWLLLHADGHDVGYRWAATAVFVVAMITDRLDGALARSRGLVTEFGKLSDPIADKALTGMALVGLSLVGELPWWVTVLVLVREVGVTVVRLLVLRHGVMPASRGGKAKTALLGLALGLLIAPWEGPVRVGAAVVLAVAVALAVVTGTAYLRQARQLARSAQGVPR
jgi:CDP-diacylglycerol--glycerol-3-phosphate 3-phosphatidyltransferase